MKMTLAITGMTCDNCVKHVTNALSSVEGVRSVKVDLASGLGEIEGDAPVASLIAAIEDEGYQARTVE
jgi:copper chaperone